MLLMLYATSGWIPTFNSEGVEILVQCSSKTNRNLKKENTLRKESFERIVFHTELLLSVRSERKPSLIKISYRRLLKFVSARLDVNSTRMIPRECHCRISQDAEFQGQVYPNSLFSYLNIICRVKGQRGCAMLKLLGRLTTQRNIYYMKSPKINNIL